MRNRLRYLPLACALAGMILHPTSGSAESEPPLALQAREILKKNCAGCHAKDGEFAMVMNYILDRDELVKRRKLVPGKAERRSKIYMRMVRGEMPPSWAPSRPRPEEIETIKRWIDAGAPNWASAKGEPEL